MRTRLYLIISVLLCVLALALPALAQETTPEPTAEVTVEPTAEITVEPTAEVTHEATEEATAEVPVEPTAEVTTEPAPPAFEMPPLPGELVVGNLSAPRGLAFDEDGNLYVAVAGSGGDLQLGEAPDGGAAFAGLSGSILSIAPDGTVTEVMTGIPSFLAGMETVGVYRVVPQDGYLWIVMSAAPGTVYGDSIVQYNPETMLIGTVINVGEFEAVNNPDGNEIDSNVADIAWGADGTLYIVDAGANALLSWTQEAGLTVVNAWSDNSVPDSIDIADNGDIYIGHLGAGLAPGAGKVEHWSAGELVETWAGLNTITDVLVAADGSVYAVQLVVFGEQGPGPGSVIWLSPGAEPTIVADGLISPFGIAESPEGELYVTFGTLPFAPGMTGGVVHLDMSGM